MHIEFYLPFPPSVNNYYTKTRQGIFISPRGRKFRSLTAESFYEQIGGGFAALTEKLLVEVVLYPPDKRTRDLDNYNKGLLDALSHCGLWEDDSQIDQLFIYRGQPLKTSAFGKGMTLVRVTEAGPVLTAESGLPADL